MRYFANIFYVLIITVLIVGCSESNEGVIRYDITYEQAKEDNPLINLMPTSMEFYYKDKKILTQIEGWMGIFRSVQLSDLEDSTNVLMVKLLDKKYYHVRNLSEDPLEFEKLDIKNLDYLEKDTLYKGYQCKKVKVIINDSASTTYNIWYTNDIDVPNPNRNNPFSDIPGVLMRFNLNIKGISLHLDFREVQDTAFPKGTFTVPGDYKKVSKQKLTEFFNELNSI